MSTTTTTRRLLPGLDRHNLATEVTAGITLVALSVPLNIGYAQIAGLPPTAGLYALVVPSLVFALTASSRQVVVAPDAAASALVASSLVGLGIAGGTEQYAAMAAAQAVVGGVLFLLCSRLRLGFLANFLSGPILVGFVGGMAAEILLGQSAKVLGIELAHGTFVERVWALATKLPDAHAWSAVLGLSCLAVLLAGRRVARAWPWALVVMVGGTVASVVLDLPARGVAVLGEVPSGLPTPAFPDLGLTQWLLLVPSAVAMTSITVAEGLMVARAYSDRNGYPQDPDRDLAGFGLANLGAGLTGGFTVGSSTSRTAAMDAAGSRTQLPSLVLAGTAVVLLLVGADALGAIPSPVIGATVAVAVSGLLGVAELRGLWRRATDEFVVAAVCFVAVLALGPISALLLAFVLALVNLVRRAAVPHAAVVTDPRLPTPRELLTPVRDTVPGVLLLRLGGPLFFANARSVADLVRDAVRSASSPVRHVVLDLESVTDVDTTAGDALQALHEELLAAGVQVHLSRVPQDTEERLATLGLFPGAQRHRSNREAVDLLAGAPPAG